MLVTLSGQTVNFSTVISPVQLMWNEVCMNYRLVKRQRIGLGFLEFLFVK